MTVFPLPLFTFSISFSAKRQACGPEVPPLAGLRAKSIGSVILDFGLRISDFFGFLFQSAFRNLVAGPSGATEFGIRNVEFGILCFFFPFRIPHSTFRILVARPV
jgi:hypothetical protein